MSSQDPFDVAPDGDFDDDSFRPAASRRATVPRGVRVGMRALFASLSLIVLVVGGVAWATFQKFQASVPHGYAVPALTANEHDPDGADQNILLIGNDTRAGATRAEQKALHVGHDTSTVNADTMMLLHVPHDGGQPSIVSFPRDSWVTIPGHGRGKINSAYPDGYNTAKAQHHNEQQAESAGILETIKTIHALTGLYVDHYMQVNLLGFYRISEAIGGVPVCLNAAQNKHTEVGDGAHGNSGINLPKGVSVIEGAQALAFVRQRHGLPRGDLDRIKRQQYFLKAAFNKIESAGTLLNPFKMRDLLQAIGRSLLTDPGLDLISLAQQFQSLTAGKIAFATIPNNGSRLIYPDGVETSIIAVNRAAMPAFVDSLSGKSDSALRDAHAAAASTVTVDVLNGTDTPKLAARNGAALQRLGFKLNTVDSTASTAKTTVEYPNGSEAQAKAVLAAVPKAEAVATPDVSRVTLVLGSNGVQVNGLATTPPSTSTSTTSTAKHKVAADGLGCIN